MMWAGGWEIHWIWMIVFWAAVIGLIAWAVTRLAPHGPDGGSDTARTILDERYARGEIDDDEYRQRRSELGR
jgi:putative membrane protein